MRRRLLSLVALLFVFALVASACGGDDDDSVDSADGGDTGGEVETGATDPPEGDTEGDTGGDTEVPDTSTTEPAATAEPVYGGEITFGTEAETNTGFYAPNQQCAVSCHTVMRAIHDPLFTETDTGEVVAFLAAGAEPNADFTEWRITAREGITFHDGAAFDGTALVGHFDALKAGTITAQVLQTYESSEVDPADPMTAIIHLSAPYADLPEILVGQLGYVSSPNLHADPGAAGTNPVGTGPFMFDSWSPGESLHVVANPDYWRTDADGNALPYLAGITFRPIPENDTRYSALASGDLDILHTDLAEDFAELEENGAVITTSDAGLETEYVMLNAKVPPLDNPEFRRALAQCTSQEFYIEARTGGVSEAANGPFAPGSVGYLEDTGYPTYDPDAGEAAIAAIGAVPVIEFQTTNSPWNVLTVELIAEQWSQCGVETEIQTLEQGENITEALLGTFGALLWRNHGYSTIAPEYVWWHSNHSGDIGALAAANFGRVEDPDIDGALDHARTTRDAADWQADAEAVNRTFGEQVYNIWLEWRPWVQAHSPSLQNVGANTLPDGGQSPVQFSGRVFLAETFSTAG